MTARWPVAVAAFAAAFAAACAPDLVDDTSIIRAPRLLAARAEPAESVPGLAITTTGLWTGPDGPLAEAPLDWRFCTLRKSLTEPGPVAPGCLVAESPDLIAFGTGATATGSLPALGCRQFGPDRPDPVPGEPAGRPADPDGTGGYYQPIRVLAADSVALVEVRLRCGLPGATPEQSRQFLHDYVPNTNPAVESAVLVRGGTEVELVPSEVDPDSRVTVTTDEAVDIVIRWPGCAEAPCGGAEPYLWFDPDARELAIRHEAIRISWFATAGEFDTGHTGRTEAEAASTDSAGRWTAPAAPQLVHVWAVLRDARGGTTWATFRIEVTR